MKVVLSGLFEAKTYDLINWDSDLIELFSMAKEVGFDGVDYLGTIPDAFFSPKKAKELSKKYDIPVLVMHAPLHLLVFTPQFLMQRVLRTIHHFPKLEVVNFHLSGFLHPLDRKGNSLKTFLKFAKHEKAPVSYESNPLMLGLGRYPKPTHDPEQFGDYCVKNNLPITFDTSHIAHCRYDVVKFFQKYHKQIKLIHLSDAKGDIQHLTLGKGELPIKKLLSEMKRLSYKEFVSFEMCNFPIGATMKQRRKEIADSLAMVNHYAR